MIYSDRKNNKDEELISQNVTPKNKSKRSKNKNIVNLNTQEF